MFDSCVWFALFSFNSKFMFVVFFLFEQSFVLMFVSAEASRTLGDLYSFSVGPGEKEKRPAFSVD